MRPVQASSAVPIAVLGAGPIGLTCALLLAARGLRCVVTDARPLEAATSDPRLLALSSGTWRVLAPLLRGADLPTAPITDVYVSSAGEFGATHLSTGDFAREVTGFAGSAGHAGNTGLVGSATAGVDAAENALGATVTYGALLRALAASAAHEPLMEVRRPLRVATTTQQANAVLVAFDDGSSQLAQVLIHAEGFHEPRPAQSAGLAGTRPSAVLADLAIAGPARGAAFERFTREGPLALLPAPHSHGGPDGLPFSLVWCMDAAGAERRAALPDADFVAELQRAVGNRIGRVMAAGPRRHVPLPSSMRERVREHRTVWLGNAAQTLHPVAGQGFNLGVRDCVTLAQCLAESRNDAMVALARYSQRRRLDRRTIEAVTQWLPGVFATTFAPMAAARTLGLAVLDQIPSMRRELARLLMFGVRT